jgi:peptidoglycan/LPS O-acetylase OafA/YrhL
MNGNYTVKAYFNTTGQDATAGGGISANDTGAVAAVLNPFLAGYMMLALFHLAIAGVAVYVTKSAVFGIGVFFLFLLVFLAGGLYPSAIWAIVIAIVAIIMTMIMAKIRGGQS